MQQPLFVCLHQRHLRLSLKSKNQTKHCNLLREKTKATRSCYMLIHLGASNNTTLFIHPKLSHWQAPQIAPKYLPVHQLPWWRCLGNTPDAPPCGKGRW